MKVRARTSFVCESGTVEVGAEFEMEDALAAVRIAQGIVEPAHEKVETATAKHHEKAETTVSRRGKR